MSIVYDINNIETWTFTQLVQWNQGQIVLAIPTGEFNQAVFTAMDLALRWKAAQKRLTNKEVISPMDYDTFVKEYVNQRAKAGDATDPDMLTDAYALYCRDPSGHWLHKESNHESIRHQD